MDASPSTDCYPYWRVTEYGDHITEVQVERETESSVWVREPRWNGDGYRVHRRSKTGSDRYFRERSQAVSFGRARLELRVVMAEERLQKAKAALREFEEMVDG